jgi:two-component system, cell cycle response regulator
LQRLANIDGLTQIPNRRCFDRVLQQEWKRLRREQAPLSLILCDIDFFKLYNDHYGHLAGDDCLKQVAQAIQQSVHRPADLAARYGGEEFAVILPGTSAEGAFQVAAQIQAALAKLSLPHGRSLVSRTVTVSMGVATLTPALEFSPEELIGAADRALYSAKSEGRNQYCSNQQVCGSMGNPPVSLEKSKAVFN